MTKIFLIELKRLSQKLKLLKGKIYQTDDYGEKKIPTKKRKIISRSETPKTRLKKCKKSELPTDDKQLPLLRQQIILLLIWNQ